MEHWRFANQALVYERIEARSQRQAARAIRKAAQNPFKERPMTDDQSADIDHLIQEWHAYARLYKPALGAPTCSVYAKDYRTSETKRYGHDQNDDSDMALMAIKAEAVEACIHQLSSIHQHAIQNWLRNRDAGADVWRNSRLGSPENAVRLYQQAKELLLPKFRAKDLME